MADHLTASASIGLTWLWQGGQTAVQHATWHTATLIGVAATLAATAAALLWRQIRAVVRGLRLLGEIGRARDDFSDLPAGPVTLRGRIEPLGVSEPLLRGPFGQHEAVYLAYHLDRWDPSPGAVGIGGRWMWEGQDEVAVPFGLSDGRRVVAVDPECARVMAAASPFQSPEPGLRYTESILRPGDEVVVRGVASAGGTASSAGPYREPTRLPRLTSASIDDPLLLAPPDLARKRLQSSLAWSCLGLLPVPFLLGLSLQVATGRLPVRGDARLAGHPAAADPVHRHGRLRGPRVHHDWPRRNAL